ncbi:hypothetical protein pb186bvf_010019 [Paramecium bursaria]
MIRQFNPLKYKLIQLPQDIRHIMKKKSYEDVKLIALLIQEFVLVLFFFQQNVKMYHVSLILEVNSSGLFLYNRRFIFQRQCNKKRRYGIHIYLSKGWSVHNQKDKSRPLVDICNNQKLFGYFDQQNALVRGIKLPPHNKAQLEIVLWKQKFFIVVRFEKWGEKEFIDIWIDQTLLYRKGYIASSKDKCDSESYSKESLKYEFDHQEESAILIIYSTLNKDNAKASWGISSFKFSVNLCEENLFCKDKQDNLWELQYRLWNSFELQKFNAEGWSGSTAPISCGVPFFGGNYGAIEIKKRTFTLKPNFKSRIKFLFARFSNGDLDKNNQSPTMIVTIKINGEKQIQTENIKLQYDYQGYYQDLCLSADFEYFYRYEFNINSPNDKIEFEITTNAKNQGWGLRDFNLYIQTCSQGCTKCHGPLGSDCDVCDEKYFKKDSSGCVPKQIESQLLILFSESFKEQTFNEFDLWSVIRLDIAYFQTCSPITIFGGYQQFDYKVSPQKQFKLPNAKAYQIKFDLYAFGLWNNQYIQVKIGLDVVHEVKIKVDQNKDFIQCGNEKLQGKIIPIETQLITNGLKYHYEITVSIESTLPTQNKDKLPSWGFRNFELVYEPQYDCALLFTQINYKGDFVELCQSNIDFGLQQFPTQIKSILVPPQGKVTLFQKSEYDGKRYIFTENTPIIEEELYLHLDPQNEQINDL